MFYSEFNGYFQMHVIRVVVTSFCVNPMGLDKSFSTLVFNLSPKICIIYLSHFSLINSKTSLTFCRQKYCCYSLSKLKIQFVEKFLLINNTDSLSWMPSIYALCGQRGLYIWDFRFPCFMGFLSFEIN
jgi:hypothetical protein